MDRRIAAFGHEAQAGVVVLDDHASGRREEDVEWDLLFKDLFERDGKPMSTRMGRGFEGADRTRC